MGVPDQQVADGDLVDAEQLARREPMVDRLVESIWWRSISVQTALAVSVFEMLATPYRVDEPARAFVARLREPTACRKTPQRG